MAARAHERPARALEAIALSRHRPVVQVGRQGELAARETPKSTKRRRPHAPSFHCHGPVRSVDEKTESARVGFGSVVLQRALVAAATVTSRQESE